MKKLLFAAALVVMTGINSLATPRIVLEDKKENYVQSETGYTLHFKLVASGQEFVTIMEQVQSLADRVTMNVSEGSGGAYDCIMVINHQNQPEYVHKMLVAIGIEELEYNGHVEGLDAIIQILYSYL